MKWGLLRCVTRMVVKIVCGAGNGLVELTDLVKTQDV